MATRIVSKESKMVHKSVDITKKIRFLSLDEVISVLQAERNAIVKHQRIDPSVISFSLEAYEEFGNPEPKVKLEFSRPESEKEVRDRVRSKRAKKNQEVKEIIKRAKELGFILKRENPALPSEKEKEENNLVSSTRKFVSATFKALNTEVSIGFTAALEYWGTGIFSTGCSWRYYGDKLTPKKKQKIISVILKVLDEYPEIVEYFDRRVECEKNTDTGEDYSINLCFSSKAPITLYEALDEAEAWGDFVLNSQGELEPEN